MCCGRIWSSSRRCAPPTADLPQTTHTDTAPVVGADPGRHPARGFLPRPVSCAAACSSRSMRRVGTAEIRHVGLVVARISGSGVVVQARAFLPIVQGSCRGGACATQANRLRRRACSCLPSCNPRARNCLSAGASSSRCEPVLIGDESRAPHPPVASKRCQPQRRAQALTRQVACGPDALGCSEARRGSGARHTAGAF
jgi:hypothetical protein